MASKAIGSNLGSAKKAFLVPVKLGALSSIIMIEGLIATAKDIKAKGRQRKAVILISMGAYWESPDPVFQFYHRAVGLFMELGVPMVSSAGNSALETNAFGQLRTNIDTAPSIFASVYPIITVGNVFWDGNLSPDSQHGNLLVVSAVGAGDICLDPDGTYIEVSGTSVCMFYQQCFLLGLWLIRF